MVNHDEADCSEAHFNRHNAKITVLQGKRFSRKEARGTKQSPASEFWFRYVWLSRLR
jgi:hypothetical protein